MSLMEWDKSFELGVGEFDEHHKYLITLLNMSYDSFTSGAGSAGLGSILDELIDYATYHFSAEEHWMRVHGFPGLQLHQEEHNNFSKRVVEIYKDFRNGRTNLSLEVLQFLKNWLSNHILKTDAEYSRFADGLSHDTH